MRQVLCPVVVGRADELAALDAALASARAGHGRLLVVSGEAGIGKTRLSREAEERAAAAGMRTLRGRAVHGGSNVPYRPVADALRGPLLAADAPLRSRLTGDGTSNEPTEVDIVPDAVLGLLRDLAGDDGLLCVLEDLHWADADTLAVVADLADALDRERVLVIVTERSDWPGPTAEVLATLVARRAASRLALAPFDDDIVEELARRALDVQAVPHGVAAALHRRAEGVPFLVEEMLTAYVAAGGTPDRNEEWWTSRRVADALPPSYRDLVRERLAHLDQTARRVVASAAVLGRTFDWRLLGRITGLSTDEVLDALRAASREQLVWGGVQGHSATFSFRHALARETLLADLLAPEVADLALRAAEVMEDVHPGLPGEWCEHAADLRVVAGDRLGASRLLQESGRRSFARGALATAEASLDRARELVADDHMAWVGVDELLLRVLGAAGKTERLIELGHAVLVAMRRYLDLSPGPEVRARVARLHTDLARGALLSGELVLARRHLQEARELVVGGDVSETAATLDAVDAQLTLAEGDASSSRRLAGAAAEAAGALDLPALLCEALEALGRAALRSGDAAQSVRAFERMEDVSSRADLAVQRVRALAELGAIDALAGETGRLLRARELAAMAAAVSTLARIDLELAWLHIGRADHDQARDALGRALETCRRFRLPLEPQVLAAQATADALRGQEPAARRSQDDPELAASLHAARAVRCLVQGRAASAREEVAAAVSVLAAAKAARPWWFEGCGVLLDPGAAPLRPAALADPANRAYVAYAEAVRWSRDGDPEAAARAFRRAEELMPEGWRRHHARLVVGEAATVAGWGDPGAWAAEALAFFERTGLGGLAAHARSVMRMAGVPVPRRGRGTAEVPDALKALGVTSRELDVLRLVALGLSNDEIGARLYLSPRTVETHVTSLLRKTGTHTRPHLVAFAARHVPADA